MQAGGQEPWPTFLLPVDSRPVLVESRLIHGCRYSLRSRYRCAGFMRERERRRRFLGCVYSWSRARAESVKVFADAGDADAANSGKAIVKSSAMYRR